MRFLAGLDFADVVIRCESLFGRRIGGAERFGCSERRVSHDEVVVRLVLLEESIRKPGY